MLKAGVRLKYKLNTAESKDFISNNYEKVEYNSLSEINNAGSPIVQYETGNVKCDLLAIFLLKIKNYYRRILIGVKNGISTPTFSAKTLKLGGYPLNIILRMLGGISMFISVTNRLAEFNNFLQMTFFYNFILNLLFFYIYLYYITQLELEILES